MTFWAVCMRLWNPLRNDQGSKEGRVPIPSVLDAEPGMGGVSGLSGFREQRPAQVPSSLL